MELRFHETGGSWCRRVMADMDRRSGWKGCMFYVDAPFVEAVESINQRDPDLFGLFTDHGEPAQDRDWMAGLLLAPLGEVIQIIAVKAPNVRRFEQFLRHVIPVPDRTFPPVRPIVIPHVADIVDGQTNPTWADVAKNGDGRFRAIVGEIVQPDDPRWAELASRWPGLGA